MRTLRKILLAFLFTVLCTGAHAQEFAPEEDVKAAFIFHFLNYTQWDDEMESYYVCIPEDYYLRRSARNILEEKTVNGRDIRVVRHADFCHVLVSRSPPPEAGVLTIGSLSDGALLEFRVINKKLKFAADMDRIKNSKLKISSQLLKMAILNGGEY